MDLKFSQQQDVNNKFMSKDELHCLVEPGLISQMSGDYFEICNIPPKTLVTWNRMDIGFRTLYLELMHLCPELASEIYLNDLRAQTMGSMIDPDNKSKDTAEVFKNIFESISNSIRITGFDSNKTLIPVSSTGSILNGCHRLSASIIHNKNVAVVRTNIAPITCDYKYFFNRAVPLSIIKRGARQLIRYSEDVFLAFLWPSGKKYINQTELLFENVIFKEEIHFKENGPFNLLYQCYNHMDWIGAESMNYPGLQQKIMECFPSGEGVVTVVAFQCTEGIDFVKKIKEKIREINGIGYSSVHITDTKEEAEKLAELIFNENGLHYLNYAKPLRSNMVRQMNAIREKANSENLDPSCFLLDGSWLLELYGIRNAADIDIIASGNTYENLGFDRRDEQLVFHRLSADELIYDSSNYFMLLGIKIVSFHQLFYMKSVRKDPKDISDMAMMLCFLKRRPIRFALTRSVQKISYLRILAFQKISYLGIKILKFLGLYKNVRSLYRYFFK